MNKTLKSDCKNCVKYLTCINEAYDIDKSEERALDTRTSNRPFILYNIESRTIFRKWWENNNISENIDIHDCYKSKKMLKNEEKER